MTYENRENYRHKKHSENEPIMFEGDQSGEQVDGQQSKHMSRNDAVHCIAWLGLFVLFVSNHWTL